MFFSSRKTFYRVIVCLCVHHSGFQYALKKTHLSTVLKGPGSTWNSLKTVLPNTSIFMVFDVDFVSFRANKHSWDPVTAAISFLHLFDDIWMLFTLVAESLKWCAQVGFSPGWGCCDPPVISKDLSEVSVCCINPELQTVHRKQKCSILQFKILA